MKGLYNVFAISLAVMAGIFSADIFFPYIPENEYAETAYRILSCFPFMPCSIMLTLALATLPYTRNISGKFMYPLTALVMLSYAAYGAGLSFSARETEHAQKHQHELIGKVKATAYRANTFLCSRSDSLIYGKFGYNRSSETTAAVTKALLFGNKKWVDKQTRFNFSSSGIMHLLALSGLHIGIIYMLLYRLLLPIPHGRAGSIIRFASIIFLIWTYTLVSGFSISTVRAAVFITIRQTAGLMFRESSGRDVTGTTILILTSFNPDVIYDIGFQLSFSAVCAIIFMFPKVRELYSGFFTDRTHYGKSLRQEGVDTETAMTGRPRQRLSGTRGLLLHIADSAAITTVCQLSSGTLAIWYFSSFPKWFLFSNIFAIPVATAVIYAGTAAVILGDVPLIGSISLYLLHYSIMFLTFIADFFS